MKKIVIIMVLVIIIGVLSTSGCVGEWVDTILKGQNFVDPQKNNQNVNSEGEVDHHLTYERAEEIVIDHVKARIAELSSTLSSSVDKSWIEESTLNGSIYTYRIHAPGVGAGVPDFEVYVNLKNGDVSDNLPSNWAAQTQSNFD